MANKPTVQNIQQSNRQGIGEPLTLNVPAYQVRQVDILPSYGPRTLTNSAFGRTASNTVDVTGLSQDEKIAAFQDADRRNNESLLSAFSGDLANFSADQDNINTDYRVRIKPVGRSNGLLQILGPNVPTNILQPLWSTGGVLFPYTPSIQFAQDVDWKGVDITHSNYETAAYSRTPAVNLSITAKYTVQTHAEGRYLLSVLHFFRTVSKMYFGKEDAQKNLAGLPPPVLAFSGYGPYMYNDVRVVVKNHSYTMDDAVNIVKVQTGTGDIVHLPSVLLLSISLMVVQTPSAQKDRFSLEKFRTGELMKSGGGWL